MTDSLIKLFQGLTIKAPSPMEVDDYCGRGRVKQVSGTCWVNAPLNCLLLTTALQPFIKRSLLSASKRSTMSDRCPTLRNLEGFLMTVFQKQNLAGKGDVVAPVAQAIRSSYGYIGPSSGFYAEKGLARLCRSVLREGSYVLLEEGKDFPSGVPIVVVSSFEGIKDIQYDKLEAAIIAVELVEGVLGGHVISYFKCEGRGFLYDSEQDDIIPFRFNKGWKQQVKKLYPKGTIQLKSAIYRV